MGKGASTGHQNKHGLNQLFETELRSASGENMLEDLSNIDDAESTQPKAARNLKKVTPAEKAVKVSVEKENKKRANSKIMRRYPGWLRLAKAVPTAQLRRVMGMKFADRHNEDSDACDDCNNDLYEEDVYVNGEDEYVDSEDYL